MLRKKWLSKTNIFMITALGLSSLMLNCQADRKSSSFTANDDLESDRSGLISELIPDKESSLQLLTDYMQHASKFFTTASPIIISFEDQSPRYCEAFYNTNNGNDTGDKAIFTYAGCNFNHESARNLTISFSNPVNKRQLLTISSAKGSEWKSLGSIDVQKISASMTKELNNSRPQTYYHSESCIAYTRSQNKIFFFEAPGCVQNKESFTTLFQQLSESHLKLNIEHPQREFGILVERQMGGLNLSEENPLQIKSEDLAQEDLEKAKAIAHTVYNNHLAKIIIAEVSMTPVLHVRSGIPQCMSYKFEQSPLSDNQIPTVEFRDVGINPAEAGFRKVVGYGPRLVDKQNASSISIASDILHVRYFAIVTYDPLAALETFTLVPVNRSPYDQSRIENIGLLCKNRTACRFETTEEACK